MTDAEQNTAKPPQLLSTELRILGALMEKQLTTPEQYPLTLNSLITACNQKSSRDPVSNYTQGEIARALQQLQHHRLVNKEYGSRAEKYTQLVIKHLELGRKHQALLCVMMLRGPQTLSELFTRTQRMAVFADKDDLQHTLDRLCNRQIPYAINLGQQSGQRGERFTHLFSGTPEVSSPPEVDPHRVPNAASGTSSSASAPESLPGDSPSTQSDLSSQIAMLTTEIASLSEELKLARQEIARLYALTGHEMNAVGDES